VLLQRGASVIVADPGFLSALVLQPLLIAVLISLSQLRPNGLEPIFLFSVVASIWFGLNNAAPQIISDRPIYVREQLAGVTPDGYLAAKISLFAIVGVFQLLLMVWVIRHANLLSISYHGELLETQFLYQLTVLFLTYLSALLLGLTISTISKSQQAAIGLLPIVILPQLLLTGVATGLANGRDGSFRSLVQVFSTLEQSTRGLPGWLLEVLSMAMYSRPAVSLFRTTSPAQVSVPMFLVAAADWLHLLFLLFATAALLVRVFYNRQQRWLADA
jgi:hypothetical protein